MTDMDEKIDNMIKAIKNESQEKSEQIKNDARNRMEKEKNKIYNQQREKLIQEYKKKEENLETSKKLHRSKKLNSSRLEIQKERNNLLNKLKNDLKSEMNKILNNKSVYEDLLKKLIVQGLVRLLEKEVNLILRKEDISFIKNNLEDIQSEFQDFMFKNTNKQVECKINILENQFLNEKEIGGVILLCNRNKIVFKNTLDLRLNISFEESIPDIRKIIFPNLK